MQLTPAKIAALLPHAGRMVLVDAVVACEPTRLIARSNHHRDPEHPLRRAGRLGVATGIELAAQCMALHGALMAPGKPRAARRAVLASAHAVHATVAFLDTLTAELEVEVTLIVEERRHAMYAFTLSADCDCLLRGRLTLAFVDEDPRP